MQNQIHDRRGFLRKSALATLTTLVGTPIVFADRIPPFYKPLAFDYDPLKAKSPDMKVLGDKPWNVESPIHLLDDAVTPVEKMFIRNNGLIPSEPIDPAKWTLTIKGESVKATKTYTLNDLKKGLRPIPTSSCSNVAVTGGRGMSRKQPVTPGSREP